MACHIWPHPTPACVPGRRRVWLSLADEDSCDKPDFGVESPKKGGNLGILGNRRKGHIWRYFSRRLLRRDVEIGAEGFTCDGALGAGGRPDRRGVGGAQPDVVGWHQEHFSTI